MSCFVQYAPYHLADGKVWDDAAREAFGQNVIDTLEERFPDIRSKIVGHQFVTPEGHRGHHRPHRGQHLPGRALAGAAVLQPAGARWSRYRTPVDEAVDVRLGHAPGRRHHGRARADRRARVPQGEEEGPEGGLMAKKTLDVIVIGGGHNGLVAAAYLAKAGQQVLVLERDEQRRRDPAAEPARAGIHGARAGPHGRAAAARRWSRT